MVVAVIVRIEEWDGEREKDGEYVDDGRAYTGESKLRSNPKFFPDLCSVGLDVDLEGLGGGGSCWCDRSS